MKYFTSGILNITRKAYLSQDKLKVGLLAYFLDSSRSFAFHILSLAQIKCRPPKSACSQEDLTSEKTTFITDLSGLLVKALTILV